MSILLNSIAIAVAIGNVIFNFIRMLQHKANQSEYDSCIARMKVFGHIGIFAAVTQAIFRAIQIYFQVTWPNVVAVIVAILVMNTLILGMVIEYEEIKWTP
ncbi:MAG: hypothetical protein IJ629_04860 [Clostridia bacterium]|nr:hypothetical protein [Clostridia bacterium]